MIMFYNLCFHTEMTIGRLFCRTIYASYPENLLFFSVLLQYKKSMAH